MRSSRSIVSLTLWTVDVKTCKISTSDKLQTFKPIFGISCKFLAKKLNLNDNLLWSAIAATLGGSFSKRNHATFQENKSKNQWFEIKWDVLMLHGLSNLVISLVPYLLAMFISLNIFKITVFQFISVNNQLNLSRKNYLDISIKLGAQAVWWRRNPETCRNIVFLRKCTIIIKLGEHFLLATLLDQANFWNS